MLLQQLKYHRRSLQPTKPAVCQTEPEKFFVPGHVPFQESQKIEDLQGYFQEYHTLYTAHKDVINV